MMTQRCVPLVVDRTHGAYKRSIDAETVRASDDGTTRGVSRETTDADGRTDDERAVEVEVEVESARVGASSVRRRCVCVRKRSSSLIVGVVCFVFYPRRCRR